MLAQTLLALGLTLVSACLVNWAYLTEHAAASSLPPLSVRAPLRAVRLLFTSRRWIVGFGSETAGFALYVVAVALAPLALVQAVAAGGIGVLAFLVARTTRVPLARRERFGVVVAIAGLMLLGVSLVGGSDLGVTAGLIPIAIWLGTSAAAAVLAVTSGATVLRDGAAFGVAAGILFAGGDVSTKVMVEDGGHAIFAPAVIGFYAAGTIVLQIGFQRGRPLTTAGIATLATNAIPIAAAMTLFAEPLPDGPLAAIRVAALAAVVAGAVTLAPRRTDDVRERARPKWGLDPIAQRQGARKSDRRPDSNLERTRASA
jgi:hypothetical protein